ncbi:quinolinate synthase NadA [Candidatus Peregrinibacteria bacterium]|jgi:quinolinate synthase|nr:quinolinate synthase NadA [Candidatus Peregrinibacteria bacterium]
MLSDKQKQLVEEVRKLKAEKNALILVHNYQRPEIYEVADFIGDSLGLCQKAADTDADVLVFCGVNFMAETAKILNPAKKVVVPHSGAGCAMADMINADDLLEFKKDYPGVPVVCYVNSTAEVKSVSDICCTSSNAVEVVRSLESDRVIFVPDQNLAAYVASQAPEKEVIAWKGHCPVHHFVNADYVEDIKRRHPEAKIIAHPETKPEVTALADYVSSTSGMLECARKDDSDQFFILTECGMTERLRQELPGKEFFGLCNMCFDMKKNTLELVLKSLQDEKEEVEVDPDVAAKARGALEKMMNVTK